MSTGCKDIWGVLQSVRALIIRRAAVSSAPASAELCLGGIVPLRESGIGYLTFII